ncbi:hypothetical protein GCM10010123_22110 [Pilimelia anulata]|uniref:Uncharacterized protein n=1 Tax=Pilimelia anulata TaxID=53371 RepID=A0A8J3B2W7_9ACTN|nr:hypothetical protein [Pilimelia anulata]GGJ91885.1 hypothetical protein GCM10010123_22110 [Pilimelia anulata]
MVFARRIAASAVAAAAAAVGTVAVAAPAAAADPAGWTRFDPGSNRALAARKECFKNLAIQHERSGQYLTVDTSGTSDRRNLLRATGSAPAKNELFELCVLGGGDDGVQVYLRSQRVRKFIQVEKYAGRLHGLLRARADALSASTDMEATTPGGDKPVFSLRSTYVDRWVTVERNYPGADDEVVRAGRTEPASGERFVLWKR